MSLGIRAWTMDGVAVSALLFVAAPVLSQDATRVAAFRADCAARFESADKAGSMSVPGKNGWLFLAKELRHISVGKFWGENAVRVTRADKPEWADPLPAILDFKAQLDKAGIQLLLLPVPPKAIVYADQVCDAASTGAQASVASRLDPSHQEFYKLLRESGVTVLDLTDDFIQARQGDKAGRNEYCKTDTHWSPFACELAAKRIRQQVKDAAWLPSVPSPFEAKAGTIEITGDLAKAAGGTGTSGEPVQIRTVTPTGKDPKAIATVDKASPVLLLGDSHCLVFHSGDDMLATGAGLVDQLAFEMGMPVDLLGVRGSGATPARMSLLQRVRGDAGYLAGKKLVVWCFTAREFTESQGWRKVPIVK